MPSDPPVTRGRSAERAAKVAPTPANEMDVLAERLADNQEETKKAMTRMTETVTDKVELLVLAQTQTTNSLSSLDETLRSLVQAMQAQATPWSPTTASPASSIQSEAMCSSGYNKYWEHYLVMLKRNIEETQTKIQKRGN